MNRTVTIESKNHKYANTYGGNICISDFCTDYEGSRNIAGTMITVELQDLVTLRLLRELHVWAETQKQASH